MIKFRSMKDYNMMKEMLEPWKDISATLTKRHGKFNRNIKHEIKSRDCD